MHLWCVAMFNVPVFWWCVQFQLVVTCHLFLSLQAERECTAGDEWFNLPATPITSELRNDLKVLRIRSAIDPQRHYKKADCTSSFRYKTVVDSTSLLVWPARPSFLFWVHGDKSRCKVGSSRPDYLSMHHHLTTQPPLTLPPTYVGWSVVGGPLDFYFGRIPKKQHQNTIVKELMADMKFRKWVTCVAPPSCQWMWMTFAVPSCDNPFTYLHLNFKANLAHPGTLRNHGRLCGWIPVFEHKSKVWAWSEVPFLLSLFPLSCDDLQHTFKPCLELSVKYIVWCYTSR